MVIVNCTGFTFGREFINSARTDRRRGLRTQHQIMRQTFISLQVTMSPIIQPRNIQHGSKSIIQDTTHLVHPAGYRTGRVFTVTYILQKLGYLITFGTTLSGNFISYAPHNHTRIITVMAKHIDHIFFCPFIKETMVSIRAFCNIPLIKRLKHHHETHFVTQFH